MTDRARWRRGQPPWLPVAALLTVVGWGGNQFTPLMLLYRETLDLSLVTVNAILSVYVLGLGPALLLTGPVSDRLGPRTMTIASGVTAFAGSALMALGPSGPWVLLAGRFVTGISVGMGMTAATTWIAETSRPPLDPSAAPEAGAKRAAMALTLGFGLGPAVTAACAQWGPMPHVVPYFPHLAAMAIALIGLRAAPEPSASRHSKCGSSRRSLPILSPRFLRVVLPAAPWIFGANGISFAVVPVIVVESLDSRALGYATLVIALTFTSGVAIQPLARRLDDPTRGTATVIALATVACGIGLATAASVTTSPSLGALASVVLGASYGLNLVSGLREVQRVTPPERLGLMTGTFYALSYSGFLLPAIMASLTGWLSYTSMLSSLLALAMVCLALVLAVHRRSR